jgi:hypothetical protein
VRTLYGIEITVTPVGEDRSALPVKLDEITGRLAVMAHDTEEFRGFLVSEEPSGDVTFLISADAVDGLSAMSAAFSWLHTAVHASGFSTPGWFEWTQRRVNVVSGDLPPVGCARLRRVHPEPVYGIVTPSATLSMPRVWDAQTGEGR